MRIGCLQFAPQVGDIDNNLNRADAVLSRANPEELDLLVLPELAFTGTSMERTGTIRTKQCHVQKTATSSESMDLKFEAPWDAFEFGYHILEYQSNFVIVSMAWLTREEGRAFSRMPNEPDMETLTYWVTRLEPLIRAENDDEIIVVFCNRTGTEDDVIYAGTSAVVGIQGGEVKVYGLLGRGQKELLIVDTENAPFAKLVYRPENGDSSSAQVELQRTGLSPSTESSKLSSTSTWSQSAPSEQNLQENPSSPTGSKTSSTGSAELRNRENTTTRTKRRPAPLTHVPRQSLAYTRESQPTSEKSPGFNNSEIPTPSAPSPTPMAIRPKLIIPQSPTLSWTPISPEPQSTQSTYSIHSVRSNQSVRSNERPPAESTPYPDSGLPLSGYPRAFPDERYGGDEIRANVDDFFVPLSPFREADTPSSPRFFWRPPDEVLQATMEYHGLTSTGAAQITRAISTQVYDRTSQTPPSIAHRSNTVRPSGTTARGSGFDASQRGEAWRTHQTSGSYAGQSTDEAFKPSGVPQYQGDLAATASVSPAKTKTSDQANVGDTSTLSYQPTEARAVAQQIDPVLQLAQDMSDRCVTAIEDPRAAMFDRPSSPKSRNCSRSRPTEAAASFLTQDFPIMIGNELSRPLSSYAFVGQDLPRPMSRLAHHARSSSVTEAEKQSTRARQPRSTTPIRVVDDRTSSTSRSLHRGRQPGYNNTSPRHVSVERPQSRNHFRSQTLQSSRRRESISAGAPRSGSTGAANYERVESVVCPNCPVHGRASRNSNAGERDSSSQPLARASPRRPTPVAIPNNNIRPNEDELSMGTQFLSRNTVHQVNLLDDSIYSTGSFDSSSTAVETLSLKTVSSSSRSPSTPTELRTPKAMVFIHSLEDTDGAEDELTMNLDKKASVMRCVDRELVQL
ncbi:N-terminal amidase [Verticillium alfalfae VaMs.102]|uniref:N-terminal amidase n=1 Tax=Verticillium alfalfae (strain VaMs.102 / ATCC MYA-4576 / FGSC 10136) TaxID=526221 RepID=C9S941_VERA1|nr:N-terminal amidase [Verticillium alfalfae VaMs.102]EEY14089.1 N-terminal amidase [Verticillium alfalfae VaMs.102]